MIGIFDSGVGGLGIYKEIRKLLPKESIIYFTDSKNCPYGEKSDAEIKKIALKNTKFLIGKGCNIIVIACNTASTIALEYVRKTLSSYTSATSGVEVGERRCKNNRVKISIVGVVPVVKTAARVSKNKRIGILATKKTVESKYLRELVNQFCPAKEGFKVFYQAANPLVALVEKSEIRSTKSETNPNFQNSNFKTICYSEPIRLRSRSSLNLRTHPSESKTGQAGVEESSKVYNNNDTLYLDSSPLAQNDAIINIIKNYLHKFIKAKIDTIALGCTHFPFLRPEIEKIMGPKVTILDSNGAVARQVARIVVRHQTIDDSKNQKPESKVQRLISNYQFYTSGNPEKVKPVMEKLLGEKIRKILAKAD